MKKDVDLCKRLQDYGRTMSNLELESLKTAVEFLKSMCDPTDTRCAISKENKEAVRLYVQTWILPRIEVVIKSPSERDYEEKAYLRNYAWRR